MSRISRRSLLTSGAAAGVLAASGLSVSAAPKKGGLFQAAIAGGLASDTWDTRRSPGFFMIAAAHGAVFDCLTEIGADGALRGELAEGWDASQDARIWTFSLRKEVQFHNGKEFGAEDVLESFALHRQTPSPAAKILRGVQSVTKLSTHQIQFKLTAPNADFPYLLADHHMVIYPAGYVELAMINGIGTGLYRVESFEPGLRLRASRVGAHYKEATAGFFDEIELINENDSSDRLRALSQGGVDAVSHLSANQARHVETSLGMMLQRVSGNQHMRVTLAESMAWTDVENVHLALKYAVDRGAFVQDVMLGYATLGADTPIGPANPYFDPNLAPFERDPEHAKYLLRRAGVDRLLLNVDRSVHAHGAEFSVLLQKQLAQVDLRTSTVPTGGHMTMSSGAGRATEDWALATYLGSDRPSGHADKTVDHLASAAQSELDSRKRRTIYHTLQRHLSTRGSMVVPTFVDHLQGIRAHIATPKSIGGQFAMDSARFAERWWHG